MGNHRRNENILNMAIPMLDSQGNVEGWFHFKDQFLSPEVRYTAFPPTTWVRLGGRFLEIDRAVPLKIRLLEAHEDYHFWCKKKQHSQRINCGEYHKDFGDVEIGYSFSSPQTHIWFAGYAIHAECFENLFLSSHNASIRVTPEHVIPKSDTLRQMPKTKDGHAIPMSELVPSRSLFEMVLEEGADFPIYAAAVPVRVETHKGLKTELVPTAEFINDCERDIIKRDAYDVGAAVAQISDPVSYPPTFPPIKPFEHAGLFWSFIYNELLNKRLSRDELEQAVKDIALLNRAQEYDREVRQRDAEYNEALNRLCRLFATPETMHKLTWPATDAKCEDCDCGCCRKHAHPLKTHNNIKRLREKREKAEPTHLIVCPASLDTETVSQSSGPSSPRHGYSQLKEHHHKHRHTRKQTDERGDGQGNETGQMRRERHETGEKRRETGETRRETGETRREKRRERHETGYERRDRYETERRSEPERNLRSRDESPPEPPMSYVYQSSGHQTSFKTPSVRQRSSHKYHVPGHHKYHINHVPGHHPERRSRPSHRYETSHPGMPPREWNAAEVEAAGKKLSEVYKAPASRNTGYDSGVVELPGSNAPLMFISGGARGEREKPVYVEASLMEVPSQLPLPHYSRPNGDAFPLHVYDQYTGR